MQELQRCFVIEIMKLVCKQNWSSFRLLNMDIIICTFSAKDIAIVIIIIVVHLLNVAIAIYNNNYTPIDSAHTFISALILVRGLIEGAVYYCD